MRAVAPYLLLALIVCVLLVGSQILLKRALQQVGPDASGILRLVPALVVLPTFWFAVLSTGAGALTWLMLLQRAPVSSVYPLISLSYVLILPAARLAFGEPITWSKIAGSGAICFGVFLVSRTIR